MKEITWDELLKQFDPSVHDAIALAARKHRATHMVIFENLQMDSSSFGKRTAAVVGPECTLQTLEKAYDTWLNDLPSQRQYPVAHAPVPHALAVG